MKSAILAGGKSRRMGGADKALIKVDGVPMIERVVKAVTPWVEETVIIANTPEAYEHIGLPVYRDIVTGMGPLSGLVTAFDILDTNELLLVACDMPFVTTEMIRFIISCANRGGDGVIPFADGREQGLLAVYRKPAIEKIRTRIEEGTIQFNEFRSGLEKSTIGEEELRIVDPELKSFININSPDEIPD